MTELLTAAQMRVIEQAAIDSGDVTGLELMERAGRGVVEAIFEEWPELSKTSHRAVVLCGPGNNGGDGFVVARLLHEWGWEVEVFLYGDEGKLPADAKMNCERWRMMGEVSRLLEGSEEDVPSWDVELEYVDLVVDAIFGTGLTRPIPKFPPIRRFMSNSFGNNYFGEINNDHVRVVAIDLPSGLCSDSGEMLRPLPTVRNRDHFADLTVTFHAEKVGQLLQDGPLHCKLLRVKDIGLKALGGSHSEECARPTGSARIPPAIWRRGVHDPWPPSQEKLRTNAILLIDKEVASLRLSKYAANHKYSHGHAYILSGPPFKTGAARLAARGALRIGAGVVTVACPPDAVAEHAAQLTAIMLTPVADAQALTAVLDDKRINAICVGPALGLDQDRADILAAVLQVKRATVVDADGLTLLAKHPDLMGLLHDKCVLTPHGGEFARMFPDIAEKLNAPATKGPAYSKVDATREAAKRAGCVVLFKGADTVIAAPDGQCAINAAHYERAVPWLATAGSGDVLAGFITGLLARGFQPMQAAETGAWLHVECALNFGPGLIAEDIPEQLPEVFRALGL